MTLTVTILGATGSIGRSTTDLLAQHKERFRVGAVVGGRDAEALAKLARETGARFAALADEAAGPGLREALAGSGIACGAGEAAVLEAVRAAIPRARARSASRRSRFCCDPRRGVGA